MLDFIGKAFKKIYSVMIWILLIIVVLAGLGAMQANPLLGFAILVVGALFIILSAGLVSIFMNIDTNIKEQNDLLKELIGSGKIDANGDAKVVLGKPLWEK